MAKDTKIDKRKVKEKDGAEEISRTIKSKTTKRVDMVFVVICIFIIKESIINYYVRFHNIINSK